MAPEFKNLEITENIFKNVKFFISGEVHEKVTHIIEKKNLDFKFLN